MSTAGRVVLLISGLSIAGCVMWSGTDTTDLLGQAQQEGRESNPPSSVSSAFSRTEEPSTSPINPTTVTIVERPWEHTVAIGQPIVPRGRDAIARELQMELKRVGCYAGALHGVWTKSTRQAMKNFSDRVNAKLPTDKPDIILLALVQGHPDKVCGVPCPSGQSLSRTQQCTPDALLARTSRTKLTAASSRKPIHVSNAGAVTTSAVGAVAIPGGWSEHPNDVAPVEPPSSEADIPPKRHQSRRTMKKHWQSPIRHERAWASDFFRHRDRFTLY
jgi:hypothetical protein